MPKFFIEQRCAHRRELEVEANDEDAAWDAYDAGWDPWSVPTMRGRTEANESGGVIRLSLDPVAAPRQSRQDAFDLSPAVSRYRAFCRLLGIMANQAGWTLGDTLSVVFHIAMPPSWSNKKRLAMEGQPHQQKPDTDNLIKALCDCLTKDDSHIWSIRAEKRWTLEGAIDVEQAREKETL